jgi:hypothetical protein
MSKRILSYHEAAPPQSRALRVLKWGAIACAMPFWIALAAYLVMHSQALILPSTLAPLCFLGFFLGLAATIKTRGGSAIAWTGLAFNAVVVGMFACLIALAKHHR